MYSISLVMSGNCPWLSCPPVLVALMSHCCSWTLTKAIGHIRLLRKTIWQTPKRLTNLSDLV